MSPDQRRPIGFGTLFVLFLVVASVGGSLTGCSSGDPAGGPGTKTRGIVLITVDGLQADQLSIWGGPVASAQLERLATEGRAWRDGWTPSPMTRPATTSYLTGQSPDRHGVVDDVFSTLPEGVPTLAGQLAAAGFRTAAFPDSSFVGEPSGLLRDFELWDPPPRANLAAGRWLPAIKPNSVQLESFRAWISSLGSSERFFGWVHISRPVLEQLARGASPAVDPPSAILADFVTSLEGILGAVSAPDIAVAVVGTFADAGGGAHGLAGVGYSVDEHAVRVPVIARIPGLAENGRAADAPVSGLDVTATLARLGGVSLPAAEGIDLAESRTAEDPMFTFSWALLDQLGWTPERAVRFGAVKRIEGLETTTTHLGDAAAAVDPELDLRMQQALASRVEPPRTLVPLDAVGELLSTNGLNPDPVPPQGRAFGVPAQRAALSRALWASRGKIVQDDLRSAFSDLRAVGEIDPDNLAALLDRGQILLLSGDPVRGVALLRKGAERYPGNPETLHWLAHSMWADNWQEGAKILEAILPYVPYDRDILYDLACARSLAGDLEGSAALLRRSIEAGYEEWEQMEVDADLRNLRESGMFARVMQELRR